MYRQSSKLVIRASLGFWPITNFEYYIKITNFEFFPKFCLISTNHQSEKSPTSKITNFEDCLYWRKIRKWQLFLLAGKFKRTSFISILSNDSNVFLVTMSSSRIGTSLAGDNRSTNYNLECRPGLERFLHLSLLLRFHEIFCVSNDAWSCVKVWLNCTLIDYFTIIQLLHELHLPLDRTTNDSQCVI